MSAYKVLRDVSNNFENELRHQLSTQSLFSAKIGKQLEDALSNKMRDVALYTSKLKLLEANRLELTQNVTEQRYDNTLQQYEETITWKLLEQITVKSLTQIHVVKALITTPDNKLDPELKERKESIINCLFQYHQNESELYHLHDLLKIREAEQATLRAEWDNKMWKLCGSRDQHDNNKSKTRDGPLYLKLSTIVNKLELMRWLIGRLIVSRCGYNWLADPHQKISLLALTRTHNTIDTFTQDE